jgi:hypothetical protein
MTYFEIQNQNGKRWGTETYPTREAAQKELLDFWKGVSGVKLSRFEIVEIKSNGSNK